MRIPWLIAWRGVISSAPWACIAFDGAVLGGASTGDWGATSAEGGMVTNVPIYYRIELFRCFKDGMSG
jgi:hypothetical protein